MTDKREDGRSWSKSSKERKKIELADWCVSGKGRKGRESFGRNERNRIVRVGGYLVTWLLVSSWVP